jgi:3-carboxy-cis,cis-muconate cycloisomerase
MAHEHERATGSLQAEWQAVPDLFRYAAGAVRWVAGGLSHLQVHPERMRANLERAGGVVLAEALMTALAETLGRAEAYRIVDDVVAQAQAAPSGGLRAAAAADERVRAALPGDRLDRVLDPQAYRGSSDAFIDRALEDYRRLRASTETRPR